MSRKDPFGEGAPAARARRRRSLAIALGLVAFVVIVFATTIIRIGQNRPDAEGENPIREGMILDEG